ncbi:hypothetical protein L596_030218 [Steinernema carpocapsae]|uniref:Nuclear receptor domain-containing protein n=1 Tax=Steinernema carpocapsae TaxID=34508 RepID=A0A4U5LS40_STECR|nr:hypothetical protein L596_030218 [Steinernema carpocapsae]
MDFFQTSFSPQTSQLSEKDMLHLQLFSGQNSSPNQYASQNQFNCSPTQYVLPDIRESVTPPKMRFLKIKQEPDFDSGGFKSACVVEMPSDSDCDAQTTSSSSPFGEATRRIVQFAEDCAVCGDRATGFHYDVASCNGCKTFFRRTVVTGRKFVCQKNGKCLMELDKTKRCACRSCRFQRCVDVGMNPNAIQYTPSTNLTLSIARKKLKRQFSSYSSSSVTISPIVSVDSEILKRIGDVLHVELKHDRLRNSTFMPFRLNLSVEEILQKQSAFGEAERYQLVQKWPVKFVAPWKEEYAEMGMKFWFYQDLYLSVEYLKTFSWFNELSTQDQTVLAKEVCMAGTALSASYQSFLKGADRVVYPDGHVPFTTLDHFRVDLEAILQKSVVQPVTKLKLDSVQYVLMKAMVFLNGDADGLSNEARDMIHEERSKYSKTLLKYLQNRLGGSEGMKQFSAICQTIIEIVRYTQNHRNYFTLRRFNFFNADDTLPPPSRLLEQTVGLLP